MSEKLPLDQLTRRRALTGAAGIGIALPVLAACGGDGGGPVMANDPATDPTSGSGSSSGAPSGGAGTDLIATSEVEVGRGAVFPNEKVVVTQPSEGEFKAFTAVCTHQGCAVSEVSEEGIVCPCHNSIFSITDGAPQSGPATVALEEVPLSVADGRISLA